MRSTASSPGSQSVENDRREGIMEIVREFVIQMSIWMRPYLSEIATAFVIAFFVLTGDLLNRLIKKAVGHMNILVRLIVFIIVCFTVYGMATAYAVPVLYKFLLHMRSLYIAPLIIFSFVMLGVVAERKKMI